MYKLVGQTHTAGRFSAEVNTDAQEISGASRFTTLTAYTVFRPWRRSDLPSFAAIPGHHFKNI